MKHCSNCGERIAIKQQFCRSCGAELAVPKKLLADPLSMIVYGLFAVLAGVIVVLVGEYSGLQNVSVAGKVFAVTSLGVMLLGAVLAANNERRTDTLSPAPDESDEPIELEKVDTTNQLPPIAADDHFPASVTEHTTTKLRVD
jgi:predicted nucleic acid-binding Zn ribbon protein